MPFHVLELGLKGLHYPEIGTFIWYFMRHIFKTQYHNEMSNMQQQYTMQINKQVNITWDGCNCTGGRMGGKERRDRHVCREYHLF
jgi:hypothetical protein